MDNNKLDLKPFPSDKQRELLRKDFPASALINDTSRGFKLTGVKAMYVIERLNDVFGEYGWTYDFDTPVLKNGEYVAQITLKIGRKEDGTWMRHIHQFGGKRIVKDNHADALKSCITDGLTKCASIIGVAHTVFKGESNGHSNGNIEQSQGTASKPATSKPQPSQQQQSNTNIISEAQGKRLLAIAYSNGFAKEDVMNWVTWNYPQFEKLSQITRDVYEQICSYFENNTATQPEEAESCQ